MKSAGSRFRFRKRFAWLLGSTVVFLAIVLPNFDILRHLFAEPSKIWAHIQAHLLKDYILSSLGLVFGTVLASAILASMLAWFLTVYEFPGRKVLSLALILPIAIPPYIGGYTYAGIVGYTGPIQRFMRDVLSITPPPGFLDIMHQGGAIFVFTLFLYPYIYVILQAFYDRQAAQIIEAGRVLGASKTRIYWQLILPLSRNALIAGGTLVAFEVLSDYGLVSYFGVEAFSTAIFKAWQGYNDIHSALKLSAMLLIMVLTLTGLERATRGRRHSGFASTRVRPYQAKPIHGLRKLGVFVVVYGVLFVALIFPLAQMAYWSVLSYQNIRLDGLGQMITNTLFLGVTAASLCTFFALIVANHRRLFPGFVSRFIARISMLGYSIPGAVIGITVLLFFIDLDKILPFRLSLSLTPILLAYLIRYLAVSLQNIDSGFEKIGMSFHESSRVLGHGSWSTFFFVDLPMMRLPLLYAFLLAFVDIVKELTVVLILRPFNFYTLATKVFEYAHDEMIPESSVASLLIVLISAIPVVLLHGLQTLKKENDHA